MASVKGYIYVLHTDTEQHQRQTRAPRANAFANGPNHLYSALQQQLFLLELVSNFQSV